VDTLVDPDQLETVLLNVAINARDAMNGVGTLTIKVENVQLDTSRLLNEAEVPPGDYLLLSIRDTGSGMTPEVAARAFEPFFTTKAEGEGTGLGLSMAYGFVRQSQGFIALSSEAGAGTTVRIYLPRSHEEESAPKLAPTGPLLGGHETILVVEDDPDVAASVIDMLKNLGYQILTATNAADALDIVRSDAVIDLLFTDVVMPGPMRSPDMAREAKLLRPELPVLFTSGYTQDAFVNGGRLDPGLQLISKPYRIEELGRKIRRMLPGQPKALSPVPAVAPAESAPAESAPAESAPATLTVARILVVEDNVDAQFLVCEMLSALGHEAEGAGDADLALALLAKNHFDLLFTDVNLPGMSGVDLARKVVAEYPQMKIVFASGYGAGTSKHVDFPSVSLPKPYDMDQLEAALKSLGIIST
jgi:CheY-like chemotaxis protein